MTKAQEQEYNRRKLLAANANRRGIVVIKANGNRHSIGQIKTQDADGNIETRAVLRRAS
jgi:hypothetical protein